MTSRRLTLSGDARSDALSAAFAAIRRENRVTEAFSDEVEREAAAACAPGAWEATARDCTSLPMFTIDPPGSMDLDQAIYLERTPAAVAGAAQGFRLRYAIADVASFVAPGGRVDAEARSRGCTIYLPDGRVPLHPPVLSEGAASLLPGQDRPAYLWDLLFDADAQLLQTQVYRARVRSRARLDYAQAQRDLDAGRAHPGLEVLAEFGRLRGVAELARGGASLPKPEQEVLVEAGAYRLRFRPGVPLEDNNAQVSLATGMAAAQLMLSAGVGIVRTMPAPAPQALTRLRRQAAARGVPWPEQLPYGAFLRTLDRTDPAHLAVIHAATGLFRGAGYQAFDAAAGTPPPPAPDCEHAALAAPYAHVTAPLRRLVDRFALAVCTAVCAGQEVPDWARQALPTLPDIMRERDQLAASVERGALDAVEAATLANRIGEVFTVTVLDSRPGRDAPSTDPGSAGSPLRIMVAEPAVEAVCDGDAEPGSQIQARVIEADIATRRVRFAQVGEGAG
ncbi:MAG: RNB domain-containing ribonuclease [Austwickia sp.]|jgi:exoribonuclease R|nr:RNB domain-containing ribonuclease [Austwickia sp.]MBK8435177.1 RNB domain-containing ribonuclease [Austwickia sp.]MBK9101269.1 RNB domain-containing ribonuclease [Austwickia sp.]